MQDRKRFWYLIINATLHNSFITEAGNKVRWELELYLKILQILEGQIMRLNWHYCQVIINEPLLDFEKILWSSATGLWKDIFEISSKRTFSVHKIRGIQIVTNKDKLNIYIYTYILNNKIIYHSYLWTTRIFFQDWISRE